MNNNTLGKRQTIVGWGLLLLVFGVLGLVAFMGDRWNDHRNQAKAESAMQEQERALQTVAFDLVDRGGKMLVWIDHEQFHRSEPATGGGTPWEPNWNNDTNIAELLQFVAHPNTPEMYDFQLRVWTLRNANNRLNLAASDLLTAMIQSDGNGTADKKFEDARRHTKEAVTWASQARDNQVQDWDKAN